MITAGLSALLLGQAPAGGADALKFMQDSARIYRIIPGHRNEPLRLQDEPAFRLGRQGSGNIRELHLLPTPIARYGKEQAPNNFPIWEQAKGAWGRAGLGPAQPPDGLPWLRNWGLALWATTPGTLTLRTSGSYFWPVPSGPIPHAGRVQSLLPDGETGHPLTTILRASKSQW